MSLGINLFRFVPSCSELFLFVPVCGRVIGKKLARDGLRDQFRSGHENSCLGFGGIEKYGEGLEIRKGIKNTIVFFLQWIKII